MGNDGSFHNFHNFHNHQTSKCHKHISSPPLRKNKTQKACRLKKGYSHFQPSFFRGWAAMLVFGAVAIIRFQTFDQRTRKLWTKHIPWWDLKKHWEIKTSHTHTKTPPSIWNSPSLHQQLFSTKSSQAIWEHHWSQFNRYNRMHHSSKNFGLRSLSVGGCSAGRDASWNTRWDPNSTSLVVK